MRYIIGMAPLFAFAAVTIQGPVMLALLLMFGTAALIRFLNSQDLMRKEYKIHCVLVFITLTTVLVKLVSEFMMSENLSGLTLVVLLGLFGYLLSLNQNDNWVFSFLYTFICVVNFVCVFELITGSLGASRSGVVLGIPTNLFGIYCGVTTTLSFYLWITHAGRQNTKSILFLASILVNSIGVLHSASYGAQISYVLTLLAFQVFQLRLHQRLLSMFAVSVMIILSFSSFTFDPFENTGKTTTVSANVVDQTNNLSNSTDPGRPILKPRSDTIESSLSDRSIITKKSFESIFSENLSNLLFGSGTLDNGVSLVLPSSGSESKFVAHNAFISFAKSYGLISVLSIISLVLFSIFKLWKTQRVSIILPFFPAWLCSLFMDLQWTYLFLFFLVSLGNLGNSRVFPTLTHRSVKVK